MGIKVLVAYTIGQLINTYSKITLLPGRWY
jgi:hypothetical protein